MLKHPAHNPLASSRLKQSFSEIFITNVLDLIPFVAASFTAALSIQFTSKVVVFMGGLFFLVGYVSSMFATKVAHLYVTYGVILGTHI